MISRCRNVSVDLGNVVKRYAMVSFFAGNSVSGCARPHVEISRTTFEAADWQGPRQVELLNQLSSSGRLA